MSLKIVRHDVARSDITSEAYYIAEDNLDASDRFLQAVEDAFQRLAEFPGMGVRREYRASTLQDLKMWPVPGFGNYLIFYKATDEILEIVRVINSARDIAAIFEVEG